MHELQLEFAVLLQSATNQNDGERLEQVFLYRLPIKVVKPKLIRFVFSKTSNSILLLSLPQFQKIIWSPLTCRNPRNFADVFVTTSELHIDDSHDSGF